MKTSQSSGFIESFGDGLGDQLLAFTQGYWIGIELGLFTNPTDHS